MILELVAEQLVGLVGLRLEKHRRQAVAKIAIPLSGKICFRSASVKAACSIAGTLLYRRQQRVIRSEDKTIYSEDLVANDTAGPLLAKKPSDCANRRSSAVTVSLSLRRRNRKLKRKIDDFGRDSSLAIAAVR